MRRTPAYRSGQLRSGKFSGIGLGGALAVFAALLAACDASDEESGAKDGDRCCFGTGSKTSGARERSALDAPAWSST